MPQTLLAVCAIMAAAMFSLNLQRSSLDARLTMLGMETSTQATEIGTRVLEYVGTRAFDRGALYGATLTSTDMLTPADLFGDNMNFSACQAIEDFHNMKPFQLTVNDVTYEVTAEVLYVTEEQDETVPSPVPTFMKEVLLEVTSPHLKAPITLSRIYAY